MARHNTTLILITFPKLGCSPAAHVCPGNPPLQRKSSPADVATTSNTLAHAASCRRCMMLTPTTCKYKLFVMTEG
eukprot:3426988-Amphidinium_carterae.1